MRNPGGRPIMAAPWFSHDRRPILISFAALIAGRGQNERESHIKPLAVSAFCRPRAQPAGARRSHSDAPARAAEVSSQTVPIATLEPKPPRWLWDDYLLRGGITLIVGAKGVGKTSLVCWLAAQASVGDPGFGGTPLRVFIDTQEDDPEVVLRPRIEAAGADLSMVETRRPGQPPWTFPRDVDALTDYLEGCERRGRPVALLVLDSLAAYIPRFTQVEIAGEALERLTLVCQRFACALVFVHHFNKYGRSVDAAIGGAGAVTRVARTVFIFGDQPQDLVSLLQRRLTTRSMFGEQTESEEARVLACVKLNVAGKPPALRFASTVVSIPAVESVHRLQLIGETNYSAEAVFEQVRRAPAGDSEREIETAISWLLAYLADGPRPTQRMVADAKRDGISQRTLERARAQLKCKAIHPAQLPERLGENAYAALSELERNAWWLALPAFPDAPPAEWTS
jgi:AAA domain